MGSKPQGLANSHNSRNFGLASRKCWLALVTKHHSQMAKTKAAAPNTDERALKHHLINKYREMIAKRYDYAVIKANPDVPDDITEEVVESLKGYFLQHLYPPPEERERLDAAFSELENYVSQPAKVWGLLGNLAGAIFRFGRQFMSALRAGLVSLEAHTSAKRFEATLLQEAIDKGYSIPLTDEQFMDCITAIPFHQMERFINDVGALFSAFANTTLLEKTMLIMKDVLAQMKRKSNLYGPTEVEAIQLGLDIMAEGDKLFRSYNDRLKKDIVLFITANERKFVEDLYLSKGKR